MSSPSPEALPSQEATEAITKSMLYHDMLEKRLVPPKELGIPLKQLFPEDWNWHFQKAYLDKYGPNADLKTWKKENFDPEILSYIGNLHICNLEIAMTSKVLLRREGILVGLAIEELGYGDFEAKWAALEVDRKQDIVLDGLVRGAFKAREKSRVDCPEMCLFGLIGSRGDGRYNLVNLLKAIVAHDPTGNLCLKSLYLFSHPSVEREYELYMNERSRDDFRAFAHLRILQRNYYIVEALLGILEAYAGKPAPTISIKEEMETKRRQACFSCGAISTEEFPVILKKCSGCKAVWYCSRRVVIRRVAL
ncbi:hypothetical protein MVEN_00628400 [Mycena venus]|uniref:MYND-type domain-containing protein n=1 Tax=Mycena venus TaxID=2733690 RepID=A0A8H7D7Z2_9AGAR|nr:hypothetical protein MVEN_00628400 [Mycena venus]